MDENSTIAALAALAQPTRLQTFRLLVAHEPDGVPAGELARLKQLSQQMVSVGARQRARNAPPARP